MAGTLRDFGYVYATKRLIEENQRVGFMYREEGENGDSGWRFFTGMENQEYVDDPNNIGIYDISTIIRIDGDVEAYLDSTVGSAFERINGVGPFKPVPFDFAPEESDR